MKRSVRCATLLFLFVLLSGLCGPIASSAGNTAPRLVSAQVYQPRYTKQADALKDLGLFMGQSTGYNLDKAATRAEAATMLVRLLGMEEEAGKGTYEHPFADVPEWADNVVGYMYQEGLTKGVSATRFGSGDACEAKMYVAFVLRALGYDEADGDFSYNNAIADAVSLSVIDGVGAAELATGDFLRDDMAAISFCALTAGLKDGEGRPLLDKLIADEAVSREAAIPHRDALDAYEAYRKAMRFNVQANDADIFLSVVKDVGMYSEKKSAGGDISIEAEGLSVFETAKLKLVYVAKDETGGEQKERLTFFLREGWLYVSRDDADGSSVRVKTSAASLLKNPADGSLSVEKLFRLINDMTQDALRIDWALRRSEDLNVLSAALTSFVRTTENKTAIYLFDDIRMTMVYDVAGRLKSRATTIALPMNVEGMTAHQLNLTMEFRYPAGGVKVDFGGLKEADYEETDSGDLF